MEKYTFNKEAIADLETIIHGATGLRAMLGSWRVVNDLPLEHWKTCEKDGSPAEVLERRRDIDIRKFSEPAYWGLEDLNRGLASLGLGEIKMEAFMK